MTSREHKLLRDYSISRARTSDGIARHTWVQFARRDNRDYLRALLLELSKPTTEQGTPAAPNLESVK